MRIKHFCITVMVAAMIAATGAQAQLTEVIVTSGNWTNPSNWSNGVPDDTQETVIGDANNPNAGITVYSGTNVVVGDVFVGGYEDFNVAHYSGSGSLTIEAGASLTTTRGWWGVGNGDDGTMATVVVDGLYDSTGALDIGGYSPAHVTIGVGGTIRVDGGIGMNIGTRTNMGGGFNYEVYQLGGTFEMTEWSGGFYMGGWAGTTTSLYKASGTSLLKAHGVNGWTFLGFWQMGGTFEIAGDVTLESPNGPAVFGTDWPPVEHSPIIKFSGTDPKLTASSADFDVHMAYPDPNEPDGIKAGSIAAQIDVSELTLSSADTWVTVIDVVAGTLQFGAQVAFVAGTDPNDWQIQAVGNQVQVKYTGTPSRIMGDVNLSTCVDDDDLSLLLANWNIGTTWGTGDLNENGTVNDDDLSLLLANWGAGCSPAPDAVPEPATLMLLGIGGLSALLRKRR